MGGLLTLPGDWKGLSREGLLDWMAREDLLFANVREMDVSSEGARLIPGQGKEEAFSLNPILPAANPASVDSLEVLFVDWTFGTEELSRYSSHIQQAESPPCLRMHPKDAKERGLKSRDRVILHFEGGPLEIELVVAENMAPGVIVLPRHRQLDWQKIETSPARITRDRIEKISSADS